jgi:hypothetical protein
MALLAVIVAGNVPATSTGLAQGADDDDTIVELTALFFSRPNKSSSIASDRVSSKFNSALGVPPQGFCRLRLVSDKSQSSADSNGTLVI